MRWLRHLYFQVLLGILIGGLIGYFWPAFGTELKPLGDAFTIGRYGVGTLAQLGLLMRCVYLTCALFIVFVLGSIARAFGFSLWKILKFVREELLIVVGTSSSESAFPGLLEMMVRPTCSRTRARRWRAAPPPTKPPLESSQPQASSLWLHLTDLPCWIRSVAEGLPTWPDPTNLQTQ